MFKRGILIVLDSVGVGELPDAELYGDKGANTLAHIDEHVDFLSLPNLEKLGLGNIIPLKKIKKQKSPLAAFGKSREKSPGKDTITGHWEIAGIILQESFPTYPNGFPEDLIKKVEEITGYGVIGNKPASGTEIINELGEEHIKTKKLIVYTSADSVFQIAAHEEVIPVEELYEICRKVRSILVPPHNVARVIARPFVGEPGNFTRTPRRHDFSVQPPSETILDILSESGYLTYGVGKIYDIFGGKGIKEYTYTESNLDGIKKTIKLIEEDDRPGLIFTNLVDFDMLYGHRNNGEGYAKALMEFDSYLPIIMDSMKEDDFLIITADHGCDPYHPGTDHTREHVPILVYGKHIEGGIDIGTRETYADIGKTILELFNIFETKIQGKSFANEIIKTG